MSRPVVIATDSHVGQLMVDVSKMHLRVAKLMSVELTAGVLFNNPCISLVAKLA